MHLLLFKYGLIISYLASFGLDQDPAAFQQEWATVQQQFRVLVKQHTDVITSIINKLQIPLDHVEYSLNITWNKINQAIQDTVDMVTTTEKINQLIWNLECQVGLERQTQLYEHSYEASKITLEDIGAFIREEQNLVDDVKSKYQSKDYELDKLPSKLKIQNYLTAMQGKKVIVSDLHLFITFFKLVSI